MIFGLLKEMSFRFTQCG